MATLVNTGKAVFTDRFAGKEYVFKPGVPVEVPDVAAKHFIGDWDVQDEHLRRWERERAAFRHGGKAPPLERVPEGPDPEVPEIVHVGGGWYELPEGNRVRGRAAALKALKEAKK